MQKHVLIVIPARYQSTRFPGKPFTLIRGIEMLRRVANIAAFVCRKNSVEKIGCEYVVATDHQLIEEKCRQWGVPVVMTSENCQNGTERSLDAAKQLKKTPDLILNLQGDNPLCPPHFITSLIHAWENNLYHDSVKADVFTPCIRLSWQALEELKQNKQTAPFSGTTVLVDKQGFAMAFSKTIIPAIRKPEQMNMALVSPVRRHIGLYAYTYPALETFCRLPQGFYEANAVEGLEQMRFLENGIRIKMVEVDANGLALSTSGVDQPEDVIQVERMIDLLGEYDLT